VALICSIAKGGFEMKKRLVKIISVLIISVLLLGLASPIASATTSGFGWQQSGNGWYFVRVDGERATGWTLIGGSVWYYFDQNGIMQTGWQKFGNDWYYLQSNGAMIRGWQNLGGVWYFFRNSGVMVTGWVQLNGDWYYLQPNGAMLTGWLSYRGSWYYLGSNGVMVAETVINIGGEWHEFYSSGVWHGRIYDYQYNPNRETRGPGWNEPKKITEGPGSVS